MEDDNVVTIEDDILESIGESGSDNDIITVGDVHDDESNTSDTESDPSSEGVSSKGVQPQSAGKGNDGDSGKVNQGGQGAGPKDLLDANGNVIAKAGAERRHYENLQRARAEVQQRDQHIAQLESQVRAFESVNSIGKELNISNEEVIAGARIIAAYKSDPVGTLKHMLTQAQAAGYNVNELGGSAVDMSAIRQMIQNELSPVTQQAQQSKIAKEQEAAVLQQYNGFMSRYPDAAVHQETLARLLKEQPDLSLEAAYYKLQSFYYQRGFDWTKSLSQIESEIASQSNNQPTHVNRPVPPGSRGGLNNADLTEASGGAMGANVQFDDIIRESMREAGLTN